MNQINITQEEQTIINKNVARLKEGVEVWNSWRDQNHTATIDLRRAILFQTEPRDEDFSGATFSLSDLSRGIVGIGLDFSGANLSNTDLSGAFLSRAILSNANLHRAVLSGSNLSYANFSKANLSHAKLRFADLRHANLKNSNLYGANLSYAHLRCADLRDANLSGADLSYANLHRANLISANLSSANFTESHVSGVKWDSRKMHGKYTGIRGIDSSYGNALFKRAAADQDYLDTLENHWKGDKWRTYLFKLWGCINYGRSIERVVAIAFGTMILFGLIYSIFPGLLELDCISSNEGCNHHSRFTAFYFSIVTLTTLGFGDITPKNLVGELIVSLEVIFGYAVLGLLISMLDDKVVRRS
jgi:uncharacterized protein YjbI with pentapeptide repeats